MLSIIYIPNVSSNFSHDLSRSINYENFSGITTFQKYNFSGNYIKFNINFIKNIDKIGIIFHEHSIIAFNNSIKFYIKNESNIYINNFSEIDFFNNFANKTFNFEFEFIDSDIFFYLNDVFITNIKYSNDKEYYISLFGASSNDAKFNLGAFDDFNSSFFSDNFNNDVLSTNWKEINGTHSISLFNDRLELQYSKENLNFLTSNDITREYEFSKPYIETNSLIYDGDKLFFSIAQMSPDGSGNFGFINMTSGKINVLLETNNSRFTHWTCLKKDSNLYWFGQWYNTTTKSQPADYIKYNTKNQSFIIQTVPNTDDCNEFISSTIYNGSIYIGERGFGGHNEYSIYKNGGGLWRFHGREDLFRIWENPNGYEVSSLITFNSKLYIFLNNPIYFDHLYASEIWTYDGNNFTLLANNTGEFTFSGGAMIFNGYLCIGGYNEKNQGILLYTKDGKNFEIINLSEVMGNIDIDFISDMVSYKEYLIFCGVKREEYKDEINYKYHLIYTKDLENFIKLGTKLNGGIVGSHGNSLELVNNTLYLAISLTAEGSAIDKVNLIKPKGIKKYVDYNLKFLDDDPETNIKINGIYVKNDNSLKYEKYDGSKGYIKYKIDDNEPFCLLDVKNFNISNYYHSLHISHLFLY
jgi:hypothetical protein